MKILVDTNILIWALLDTLPLKAKHYISDNNNQLFFSPISIWEVAIKKNNSKEFPIDPLTIHAHLIDDGYIELPVHSIQVLQVKDLPLIHKDPFDRLLIAQAKTEGMMLLTADKIINQYDAPVLYCPRNKSPRR
jgi:PIN domain nuclease of toxin-antitoxin system